MRTIAGSEGVGGEVRVLEGGVNRGDGHVGELAVGLIIAYHTITAWMWVCTYTYIYPKPEALGCLMIGWERLLCVGQAMLIG